MFLYIDGFKKTLEGPVQSLGDIEGRMSFDDVSQEVIPPCSIDCFVNYPIELNSKPRHEIIFQAFSYRKVAQVVYRMQIVEK